VETRNIKKGDLVMAKENRCPKCSANLPEDAPHGLCPQCLMKMGLESNANVTADSAGVVEGLGTVVGRYELLELIGEGGMGMVYLAEQKEPVRRRVALKIVKLGMDTKQVIARFEVERQVLALLDHPNIARVFDAGTTETGRPYFVMEYVKGMSITKYCDREKLSIEKRLKLFLQVCYAVQHAHHKGIIHRDIKPSNILVSVQDDRPVPKIIDFGVAKAVTQPLTEHTLYTKHNQLLGTPEYMSPEQMDIDNRDIDTRADIYSLGVVLYELLTGVLPFDHDALRNKGFLEVQRILREEEPPHPSIRLTSLGQEAKTIAERRHTQVVTLARRLHRELEWIPLKAMRKNRSRRYRSASELADDIQKYLDGAPLIAGPETAIYRVKKFVRKHAGSVATVALVAAVIVLGLVVSTALYFRAEKAFQKEAVARTQAEEAKSAEAKQRQIAEDETKRAKELAENQRKQLYFNRVALAEATYRHGHIGHVYRLLETCPEDLRGWEWYRLNHISDQSLITIKRRGSFRVFFSPDGKRVVSGGRDHNIKIWDSETGAELMTIHGHQLGVTAWFSPDGKRIVSSSNDDTIRVWDAASGEELTIIHTCGIELGSASVSSDGRRIVSALEDGTIKVWDAASGEELISFQSGHEDYVLSVVFSPNGKHIVSGSVDKTIKVWDASTGDEFMTLQGHKNVICSVAFSPDGKRIVSGSGDTTIKMWDASTGAELMTLRGHRSTVKSVGFSSDGERIVSSGSWDNMIKVWDAESGEELMTLRGHRGHISWASLSPDGERVVSCGDDATIKVWDVSRDTEKIPLYGHKEAVNSIAFSPNGQFIISGGDDGTVKIWDTITACEVATLRGHKGGVSSVAFSPDGRRIVSGGRSDTVKVWDVGTGNEMMTLRGHAGAVSPASFSPDGKCIVTGSKDKTLKIWDSATGTELMTLHGHKRGVWCVAFSPNGKRIVSGSDDEKVKIWDAETGDELMTLPGHKYCVYSVSFSPDGKRIISSGFYNIKVWDVATGAELMTLRTIADCVAFSPDGKRIISSGTYDMTVKIWDAETGAEVITLRGHTGTGPVAFSPDGRTVALGSWDGDITLWESASLVAGYGPRRTAGVARKVVDQLQKEYNFYSEVINRLKLDNTLDRTVQSLALQIANARQWEDAQKLNKESWEVVRLPGGNIESYQSALKKAKKAKDMEPDNWSTLNALGAAQYRVEAYQDALTTLTNSDKIYSNTHEKPHPENMAFTAMLLHQLGRDEEAQVAIGKFRTLFEDEQFAKDSKLQGLLIEAEKLFAGENTKLHTVWGYIEAGKLDEAVKLIKEIRSLSEQQDTKIAKGIKCAAKWLGRIYYKRAKNARPSNMYAKIFEDYETAVAVDLEHAEAFNNLAWLRTTCPAAEFRDVSRAVEAATRACELTNWQNHNYLSTLAAAYSETGDFTSAAKWQEKAIDLLPENEMAKQQANYEERLKLYKSDKPYHQGSLWSFSDGELLAWWTFDEAEDGKVMDSSGNGLLGALMGNAKIISDPERNNVLSLDGESYVDCGKNPAFDITGSLTVACWIKVGKFDKGWPSVISRGEYIWGLAKDRGKNGAIFWCSFVRYDNSLWAGSGNIRGVPTGGRLEVNDGQWHHLTGVYDGKKIYLYVDGVLDDYTNVRGILSTADYPLYIGKDARAKASGSEFNGLIDDVRIYSYALSQTEIAALSVKKPINQ
jgi:WD40 repeat protein/tetratricopeptide (TPR) repeat protein